MIDRLSRQPLPCLEGELLHAIQYASFMVKPSNDIGALVLIVCTHREVLPPKLHIPNEGELALVINDVAFLTRDGNIPLLAPNKEEFVVRDVERLEVARKVMLG